MLKDLDMGEIGTLAWDESIKFWISKNQPLVNLDHKFVHRSCYGSFESLSNEFIVLNEIPDDFFAYDSNCNQESSLSYSYTRIIPKSSLVVSSSSESLYSENEIENLYHRKDDNFNSKFIIWEALHSGFLESQSELDECSSLNSFIDDRSLITEYESSQCSNMDAVYIQSVLTNSQIEDCTKKGQADKESYIPIKIEDVCDAQRADNDSDIKYFSSMNEIDWSDDVDI